MKFKYILFTRDAPEKQSQVKSESKKVEKDNISTNENKNRVATEDKQLKVKNNTRNKWDHFKMVIGSVHRSKKMNLLI